MDNENPNERITMREAVGTRYIASVNDGLLFAQAEWLNGYGGHSTDEVAEEIERIIAVYVKDLGVQRSGGEL